MFRKLTFSDFGYVDPFEYESIIYPTITHAYYGSMLNSLDALKFFLKSPLDPIKTFSMIKDEFKTNSTPNLIAIIKARFLRDDYSIKKLSLTEPSDPWIKMVKDNIDPKTFIQQELFWITNDNT